MSLRHVFRLVAWTLAAFWVVAALFFYGKMREGRQIVDAFLAEALQGVAPADTNAVAHALAVAIYNRTNRGVTAAELPLYERLEATGFFNVPTPLSLKRGIYSVTDRGPFGPCGTMSRVLLNTMWRLHLPARKLQLLAPPGSGHIRHTMVEYRVGDRWQVISPSDSGFVWRDSTGRVATVAEIRSDPRIFDQIHRVRPWWPADFEHTANIRWDKLPAPVRSGFRLVLGEQRFRDAETPRIYDQPRRFYFYSAWTLAAMFALLGWWVGRRPAARGGHPRPDRHAANAEPVRA